MQLAAAGRSVVVFEAAQTPGGGTRSAELTRPGFVHDICSSVHPLLLASPFFREIGLERLGIEVVQPEVPLAHPLADGGAALLLQSLTDTAAGLGEDRDAYLRLMSPLANDVEALLPSILAPLRFPAHPFAMARFGLTAVRSAETLARARFRSPATRGLFAGIAAHSMLPLDRSPTAGVGALLGLLAHAVGWPLVRGGSQKIADGLTALLTSFGGEVVTGRRVTSMGELPPARAYLFDTTPRELVNIAGDRLPARYRKGLTRFRYGPGVFKVDWALSEPVPWAAEGCKKAGTVHLGWTLEEIAESEADVNSGRHNERPFVIVVQPTVTDPSRAPAGGHVLWAYCHVPSGSERDMTRAIEDQIERFAPGFRDTVVARATMHSTEMETYNANYVGGDINGGIQDLRQHFARPLARISPYTTPAKDIYICSSSTPPGGGVHGMCGYHAARAALRRVF